MKPKPKVGRKECPTNHTTMKPKPKVGQKLWRLYNPGHRREVDNREVVVTKVGLKYFTVSHVNDRYPMESMHHIDTWKQVSNVTAWYHLYETEQDYLDEKEQKTLLSEIQSKFRDWGYKPTLEQLRAINEIINVK